jgi:hypothetical protein
MGEKGEMGKMGEKINAEPFGSASFGKLPASFRV